MHITDESPVLVSPVALSPTPVSDGRVSSVQATRARRATRSNRGVQPMTRGYNEWPRGTILVVTRRHGALLFLFLLALVAGCGDDEVFELFVDLKTDYVGGIEATSVRTVIRAAATMEPLRDVNDDLATADLTTGRRVAELADLPAGTYLVDVTLGWPGRRCDAPHQARSHGVERGHHRHHA